MDRFIITVAAAVGGYFGIQMVRWVARVGFDPVAAAAMSVVTFVFVLLLFAAIKVAVDACRDRRQRRITATQYRHPATRAARRNHWDEGRPYDWERDG